MSEKQLEILKINECFDSILKYTTPLMNQQTEGSTVNSYQYARYLSIQLYFTKRLDGLNKSESSLHAAKFYWLNNSQSFRAKTIVRWAKEFYEHHCLSKHSQGAHVKRESFVSDNDVKLRVLELIKTTKPAERSLKYLKTQIEENIVPSLLGTTGNISITALSNYLYEWGYQYRKNKKQIFFDGHEREDVVEYRNSWSKRMMKYMKRSDFYDG